jgi:hypothetical protein
MPIQAAWLETTQPWYHDDRLHRGWAGWLSGGALPAQCVADQQEHDDSDDVKDPPAPVEELQRAGYCYCEDLLDHRNSPSWIGLTGPPSFTPAGLHPQL